MGLNFYVSEVQAQANQASRMNNQASQAIASLQRSIQSFLSAPLSSKAYDSAKSYFMVAYTPLCQSAIMTGEALESANKRLLSDYQSMVCGINTIEDEILEQIARFEEVKRDIEQQMSMVKTTRPDLERRYVNACETIEKRREKLRKFHEYNTHSASIFSDYEASEAEFSTGLNQVANCKAWNPATGTFDMTRLNMSWAKPIHNRWQKRERMRQEKLKKIQGKLDEDVIPKNKKELFEHYYWSTNANAWISKKTGKPVPGLSGVVNKMMRTEPPKMNNELLEYYNRMVTTGIDPLTGRKLIDWEIQQARLLQIATALTPAYQATVLAKMAPEIEGYGKKKPNPVPEAVPKLDNLAPAEINQMSLEQLRNSIPEGWKIFENNGRVHVKDAGGQMRVRIDPPDTITDYQHMHVYDDLGNPLDRLGSIVDRTSPDGHLPWNDK